MLCSAQSIMNSLSMLKGNVDMARNKTQTEELIQSLLKSVAVLLRSRARALLGR